jgi:glycosyltransferase involved in cell wall biosynthesis
MSGPTNTAESRTSQNPDLAAGDGWIADGAPNWAGAVGVLGYLTKMFPRVSETFILREIMALRAQGIPVRIYSLMPPTRDAHVQSAARDLIPEVVYIPLPGFGNLRCFLAALGTCLRWWPRRTLSRLARTLFQPRRSRLRGFHRAVILATRMRQDRVAHLHAAWAHTPASVARIASRIVGTPWSMGAHAKDIHLSAPASLAKKMAEARFTTVCSRAYREDLQRIGRPEDSAAATPTVLMHHHGVDTSYFSPAEPRADHELREPLLVSVGRLVDKKGFADLVNAAALLRDRGIGFRLDIYGAGPLRGELAERIARQDLRGRVTLRGMAVWEEIRAAYRDAAGVVLASRITQAGDRDGIPNTLAEAMACGTPVVATDLPSIRELIDDGTTGLIVPSRDPVALAAALERLLADPSLARRLAGEGRRWVTENFDADIWGKELARRLAHTAGIERVLYINADRGVPVRGGKGASVHVRAVIDALVRAKVSVRLLAVRSGPSDGPVPGAPIISAGSGKRLKKFAGRLAGWFRGGVPLERTLLRLCDNVFLYRAARRQLRTWRPDFIYERYALTALVGSLLARRLGIPHVLEVNAPLAEEEDRYRGLRLGWLARSLEGWVMRRADRVVVVSEALANHCRRLGVSDKRILVLPNAVNPDLFHPQLDGRATRAQLGFDSEFVIGFTGTLKPWHGLTNLLHAVAGASSELDDCRILIVGDGPLREQLASLAETLAIGDRVHFLGHVPHDDVGRYVAACDVLTAPYGEVDSHWFSPLKVAEYLAAGRPVVASAIGQLATRYDESTGVLLVPPGDIDALGRALATVARDARRREVLAAGAVKTAAWTWDALTSEMLSAAEGARRERWRWTP